MTTHAVRHAHATPTLPLWLAVAFLCGAISVLLFHQGAAALLHALELTPRAPYSMTAHERLSASRNCGRSRSGAACGGRPRRCCWLGLQRRGAGPRRHGVRRRPADAGRLVRGGAAERRSRWRPGFVPAAMLIGPIVNAAWGLGTGLGTRAVAESARRCARVLTVSAGCSGRRRKSRACPASGCRVAVSASSSRPTAWVNTGSGTSSSPAIQRSRLFQVRRCGHQPSANPGRSQSCTARRSAMRGTSELFKRGAGG